MKARTIGLLALILIFFGCGAMEKRNAANELQQSDTNYKECLSQAAGDPAKCATQKEAYEVDLETYEALRGKKLNSSN